jgi:hypothetical protein
MTDTTPAMGATPIVDGRPLRVGDRVRAGSWRGVVEEMQPELGSVGLRLDQPRVFHGRTVRSIAARIDRLTRAQQRERQTG